DDVAVVGQEAAERLEHQGVIVRQEDAGTVHKEAATTRVSVRVTRIADMIPPCNVTHAMLALLLRHDYANTARPSTATANFPTFFAVEPVTSDSSSEGPFHR